MYLRQLKLLDFRSYDNQEFDLTKKTNLIWGKNASGKTNFLEAIYLLSLGESFRAKRIDEMVRFGQELGRIEGRAEDEAGDKKKLEMVVTRGEIGGKKVAKRRYVIDGAGKQKKTFVGNLPLVLFRPEDLRILSGSPDGRRIFLDNILSQVDPDYVRSLGVYNQALKRRNKILDAIKEGVSSRHSLTFWDGLLIKHGQVLTEKRGLLVGFISNLWGRSELFNHLRLEYDQSVVSEKRLEQYKEEEVAVGYTLVGPHKDDIFIFSKKNGRKEGERDLAIYGSRGEQRMAVLALKMGEIYFIEEKLVEKPLLLLDDIFSELDDVHKKEVLRVMEGRQVLVTTADEEDINLVKKVKLIRLEMKA